MGRWIRLLLFLAVVAAFLAYGWPSLYRYDHISIDGDVYPVRIHRVTGDADMLTSDGWVPMAPEDDGGAVTTPGPT
jgi:hypothetical protein